MSEASEVGAGFVITCVSMGNPHAVVFVEDLDRVDLAAVGPVLEHAAEFPQRINAHFVYVDSPAHVTMRTWERGSGITEACGTGACAVCVAGAVTKRTGRAVTAKLAGGDLELEWAADDHVYMTGPAAAVYTGDWPDADA
jgi:diaminopimelate epimerase